jgi:hypothetical protein
MDAEVRTLLRIEKDCFVDEQGRKTLLRGVNLGGSSKVPMTPNGATHIKTDFKDRDKVSFVGRPFPLEQAQEHFQRIRHWGFNALRLVITWEAIEHANPNQYDKAYLDYLEELAKIAEEYHFYLIVDPHQDVWSRASGGDGAPVWTFEKVGLDFTKFDQTEAALVMQYRYNPKDENAYPAMSWVQNRIRFANATMWTLFFGGRDFAPSCRIDGVSAQDYLQQHYLNAFKQVATRLKGNRYVIGFETLNEPSPGWIGQTVDGSGKDLSQELGYTFTPLDAMLTAAGYPRTVPLRAIKTFGIKEIRRDKLNPTGAKCWLPGFEDIWRREGLWDIDEKGEPLLLHNDHFTVRNGKPVQFLRDYFAPFVKSYAATIRTISRDAVIFVVAPEAGVSGEALPADLPENVVNASHWYDVATIGLKRFMGKASFDATTGKTVIGEGSIRRMFRRQLAGIKTVSAEIHGGIPTVIGETGLCYDLDKGAAYQQWKTIPEKAWKTHVKALSSYYDALDANLLHALQWNYTPDNTNQWGDRWNLEDFSIFSRDQQADANDIGSGGRGILGFCRPHFVHVAGSPRQMKFTLRNRIFLFEWDADTSVKAPTILYIPRIHYPHGFVAGLSEGEVAPTSDSQLFAVRVRQSGVHTLTIEPKTK